MSDDLNKKKLFSSSFISPHWRNRSFPVSSKHLHHVGLINDFFRWLTSISGAERCSRSLLRGNQTGDLSAIAYSKASRICRIFIFRSGAWSQPSSPLGRVTFFWLQSLFPITVTTADEMAVQDCDLPFDQLFLMKHHWEKDNCVVPCCVFNICTGTIV